MGTTVQCQPASSSSNSSAAAEKKLRKRKELDAIVAKARKGKQQHQDTACLILGGDDTNGDSAAGGDVSMLNTDTESSSGFIAPSRVVVGSAHHQALESNGVGHRRRMVKVLGRQHPKHFGKPALGCQGLCGLVTGGLAVLLLLMFALWLYVQIRVEMGSFRLQLEQGRERDSDIFDMHIRLSYFI